MLENSVVENGWRKGRSLEGGGFLSPELSYDGKEILYRNPVISTLSPIPLQQRQKPPVIPHGTLVGLPPGPDGSVPEIIPESELPATATAGALNVYESRFPMPEGVKITHLRIWQVLPKTTPQYNNPMIGYGDQNLMI